MSIFEDLKQSVQNWDKMEGASTVYFMYGWNKQNKEQAPEKQDVSEDSEEPDYRDRTHGERNTKYLDKARFYANTPQARLKRERTERAKDIRGH